MALGYVAQSTGTGSIALGTWAVTQSEKAIAIGSYVTTPYGITDPTIVIVAGGTNAVPYDAPNNGVFIDSFRDESSGSPTKLLKYNTTTKEIFYGTSGSPINAKTSAYTLLASDSGKTISITTGGVTVPASVLAAGDMVTIYNNSGTAQTITQGAGLTLQWAGQTSSTTGNRTLGLYGMATLIYISATNAVITGAGLT